MRIPGTAAATRLASLKTANADLGRAAQLAARLGDRTEVTVGEAQDLLSPGASPAAKGKALQRLVAAVAAADIDLTLDVEGAKQLGDGRRVGFAAEQVADSKARLEELNNVGDRYASGRQAARWRDGKPVVGVFLSYSEEDYVEAGKLWKLLQEYADIDKTYAFDFWDFTENLVLGGNWHPETLAAVERNELGIFAVSRHFLSSTYIHQHELPSFIARQAAVPVLLETMELGDVEMKGLTGRQIYGCRPGEVAFDKTRGVQRNEWAQQLLREIRKVLEKRGQSAKRPARPIMDDLDRLSFRCPTEATKGSLPGYRE